MRGQSWSASTGDYLTERHLLGTQPAEPRTGALLNFLGSGTSNGSCDPGIYNVASYEAGQGWLRIGAQGRVSK